MPVPPEWILQERLEVEGISHAEFARRCGRSPKLISEIISGKAPLEPGTALQFEKVLGVDASIWLGIESEFRLQRAREAEAQQHAAASAEWVKAFPVRDLVKRGLLPTPEIGYRCRVEVAGVLSSGFSRCLDRSLRLGQCGVPPLSEIQE